MQMTLLLLLSFEAVGFYGRVGALFFHEGDQY